MQTRFISVLLSVFIFFVAQGYSEEQTKKTVCLNMIIKNESKVITRCLGSLKSIIDYWVIVDTGSTDGTQQIVKDFMKDIPGELHERPWKNFAHNRNEALSLAEGKGDYILIIDADEVFDLEPGFKFPKLDKDYYLIMTDFAGMNYYRNQLINNHIKWKWVGVLHEVLMSDEAKTNGTIEGIKNVVRTDGARSQDPDKFKKDARILEEALKEDPNNTRTVFYLAQSYRDGGEHELALANYERRVRMGGWDQEVYWALLQVAILKEILARPATEVVPAYLMAYKSRPQRAEALFRLANYYRRNENYVLGYITAAAGLRSPLSNDVLFVERWVHEYGMQQECGICAFYLGKFEEAATLFQTILDTNKILPPEVREQTIKNINFANQLLNRPLLEVN